MTASDVLTSWKDIANYLGKGVRTVQRWESELGLPIRRPNAHNRNVVIALRSEIDDWMAKDFATRGSRQIDPDMKTLAKTFRFRVLVVDDDYEFRETMKAVLEAHGYEVLAAEDGFSGLATLKEGLPDIIISDLRMPNMSGFEFLSVIRYRFPRLPVIAVSGEFMGVGVPESVLADAYFEKGTYSPAEFLGKVSDLLNLLPPRPREGKPCKSPVWIPTPPNGHYVVVTCQSCLRTFPAMRAEELKPGAHNVPCDYCGTDVCFEVTDVKALAKIRTQQQGS